MFEVLKRLAGGHFVRVDLCDSLLRAVQLAEGLNGTWPGSYLVRDSQGKEVSFTGKFR